MEDIHILFKDTVPSVDYASLRFFGRTDEVVELKKGTLSPLSISEDLGVMVQVFDKNGWGYAATNDLTISGVKGAFNEAQSWARSSAGKLVDKLDVGFDQGLKGEYESEVSIPWSAMPIAEKVSLLNEVGQPFESLSSMADWTASLWYQKIETHFLSTRGSDIHQVFHIQAPHLQVTAQNTDGFQSRTLGGYGCCGQGGLEHLDRIQFRNSASRMAREVEELLASENCPSGDLDLVIDPDQMILQIHESIGHPLELDRILGDERNYAGRSFVTPDMFGRYQYGSELLNIVFDPTHKNQMASYNFDDDGSVAAKHFIIEKGILKRGLGGSVSQSRSGLEGVSCSRSVSWNRPPIDRMANLNLEPGESSIDDLISGIEKGIYLKTNNSWSIDDSRNKFQFGCEWGQLIENGKLTKVVKNPGYRGISASFWKKLSGVGDESTVGILGTPYCGKGEPNQAIGVGHASPVCRFDQVEVFGGAS